MHCQPSSPLRAASIAGFCSLAFLTHSAGLKADEQPVSIVAARISGHIHPSLCRTKDGTLVVVYKGANVLMRSRSTDGGKTVVRLFDFY